jgi:hypothetical protein
MKKQAACSFETVLMICTDTRHHFPEIMMKMEAAISSETLALFYQTTSS